MPDLTPKLFNFVIQGAPSSVAKRALMAKFADGVSTTKCKTFLVNSLANPARFISTRDFALIWGYSKWASSAERFWKRHGGDPKNIIFFEGNVLKARETIKAEVYRFPMGSIFNDEAYYMEHTAKELDEKYTRLSEHVNLNYKPWAKNKDGHILIYMNRGGSGWGNFGVSVWPWLEKTVYRIREFSNRPIIVKDHPGRIIIDKEEKQNKTKALDNIKSLNVKFMHDVTTDLNLKNKKILNTAHSAVVLGSTAGLVSMMEGIPSFADHPKAVLNKWSCGRIEDIESPKYPSRDEFVEWYCKTHWVLKDVEQGQYWNKLLKEKR